MGSDRGRDETCARASADPAGAFCPAPDDHAVADRLCGGWRAGRGIGAGGVLGRRGECRPAQFSPARSRWRARHQVNRPAPTTISPPMATFGRSEEHTSELQSRENLVCRLLLEKKKKK